MSNTEFGFVDTPSVITITPDQTATMHCQLNYSVSCGTMIQANAIIIISADNYSTHEVCIPEARHDFHTEFEYITATCNYDSIQQYVQNMNTVTYTITLKGFNESSLREFVVVCGASRRNSVTEPFIRYSGLLHRNVIIKVEEQPMGKSCMNYTVAILSCVGCKICMLNNKTILSDVVNSLIVPQLIVQLSMYHSIHDKGNFSKLVIIFCS